MKLLATVAFGAALFASDPASGIRPRPSPADYPAQDTGSGVTIGAAVVPASQLKGLFSTDLGDYVVIEASVYPEAGKQIDISNLDFALRVGANQEVVRAANPRAIAASLQRKNAPPPSRPSDIVVVPTASIGWESGGGGYDPATGRTYPRSRGVYTETGVGVGVGGGGPVGPPRPASTDRDRQVMTQELEDKALPTGKTDRPVAGYLYFPLMKDKSAKGGAYELQYYTADGKLRVLFPAGKK